MVDTGTVTLTDLLALPLSRNCHHARPVLKTWRAACAFLIYIAIVALVRYIIPGMKEMDQWCLIVWPPSFRCLPWEY